jgi:hypothetical protein
MPACRSAPCFSNDFVRRFGTQAWQSQEFLRFARDKASSSHSSQTIYLIHLESKKDMNKKNGDKRWVILFIIVSILSLIGVSVLTFVLTKLIKG